MCSETALAQWHGCGGFARQGKRGWGTQVVDRLSTDLRHDFPDMRGISPRNLRGSCPHLMKRGKTKLATIGRNIEFGLALGTNRYHQSCTNRKSANNNGDGRRSIFGERTGDSCRRQSRLIDA